MPPKSSSAGTKIVVDLGGVKLPSSVEKQLEADIRRAVLHAIAGVDLRTQVTLPGPRLPRGTIGIILLPQLPITAR